MPSGCASTTTSDWSTRRVSRSSTSSGSMPSPGAHGLGRLQVQPPANTASRANSARSGSESRSWLQSTAARSVWWRGERGPAAPGQQPEAVSRRAEQLLRRRAPARGPAASSSASGMPSSRRQISRHGRGVRGRSRRSPAWTAAARSTKRPDRLVRALPASSRAAGAELGVRAGPARARARRVSPATPSASRLVARTVQAGAGPQQGVGQPGAGPHEVLAVVQHQQQAPGPQRVGQRRPPAAGRAPPGRRARPRRPGAPAPGRPAAPARRSHAPSGKRVAGPRPGHAAGPGGSCPPRPARSASAGARRRAAGAPAPRPAPAPGRRSWKAPGAGCAVGRPALRQAVSPARRRARARGRGAGRLERGPHHREGQGREQAPLRVAPGPGLAPLQVLDSADGQSGPRGQGRLGQPRRQPLLPEEDAERGRQTLGPLPRAAPPPSLSGCCRPNSAVPAHLRSPHPWLPALPAAPAPSHRRPAGDSSGSWPAPRRQPRVAPGRARDGPRHYPRHPAAWVGPRNCAVTRRPSTHAGAAGGGRPATRMRRSPAGAQTRSQRTQRERRANPAPVTPRGAAQACPPRGTPCFLSGVWCLGTDSNRRPTA